MLICILAPLQPYPGVDFPADPRSKMSRPCCELMWAVPLRFDCSARDRSLTKIPAWNPLCVRAGADAFMLEALFRADAWGFMLQPVSPDNERAVCQSMIDGCR